jgi:hypothetical protein
VSQENVEIARRAFTAALGRPPDWPIVNALFDPEHELVQMTHFVGLVTTRDGRVTRTETLPSWEEALKAVGLEE